MTVVEFCTYAVICFCKVVGNRKQVFRNLPFAPKCMSYNEYFVKPQPDFLTRKNCVMNWVCHHGSFSYCEFCQIVLLLVLDVHLNYELTCLDARKLFGCRKFSKHVLGKVSSQSYLAFFACFYGHEIWRAIVVTFLSSFYLIYAKRTAPPGSQVRFLIGISFTVLARTSVWIDRINCFDIDSIFIVTTLSLALSKLIKWIELLLEPWLALTISIWAWPGDTMQKSVKPKLNAVTKLMWEPGSPLTFYDSSVSMSHHMFNFIFDGVVPSIICGMTPA